MAPGPCALSSPSSVVSAQGLAERPQGPAGSERPLRTKAAARDDEEDSEEDWEEVEGKAAPLPPRAVVLFACWALFRSRPGSPVLFLENKEGEDKAATGTCF